MVGVRPGRGEASGRSAGSGAPRVGRRGQTTGGAGRTSDVSGKSGMHDDGLGTARAVGLLLDSQAFLRWAQWPDAAGARVRPRAIRAETRCAVSAFALWELSLSHALRAAARLGVAPDGLPCRAQTRRIDVRPLDRASAASLRRQSARIHREHRDGMPVGAGVACPSDVGPEGGGGGMPWAEFIRPDNRCAHCFFFGAGFGSRLAARSASVTVDTTPPAGTSRPASQTRALRTRRRWSSCFQLAW